MGFKAALAASPWNPVWFTSKQSTPTHSPEPCASHKHSWWFAFLPVSDTANCHSIRDSACIFSLLHSFMKACWCSCGEACSDPDWREAGDAKRRNAHQPDPSILWYGGELQGLIQSGAVPHALSPSNESLRWEVRGEPKLFSQPPDPMIFQPSSACSHCTSSAPSLATSHSCGPWRWQRAAASVTPWPGAGREEGSRRRQRGSWLRKVGW